MDNTKIRYLVTRLSGGRKIYYWVPSKKLRGAGFSEKRLADNKAEAIAQAQAYNTSLDRWYQGAGLRQGSAGGPIPGSLRALDELFQKDEEFRKRIRSRTQRDYLYSIKPALEWIGDEQVSLITRRAIVVWYRDLRRRKGAANSRNAMSALRRLLTFGHNEGWMDHHPALRMDVAVPEPRTRVWETEERDTFCRAALAAGRPSMALAVMLGWCLGQRPADLRTLKWSDYDGSAVRLRQAKTKTEVWVPALPELRAVLGQVQERGELVVISENTGWPYLESDFQHTFAEIRAQAGLPDDLQFRDLRRTLATALGAAGCSEDEIMSITGHKTRSVLQVYVQPSKALPRSAMQRLQVVNKND